MNHPLMFLVLWGLPAPATFAEVAGHSADKAPRLVLAKTDAERGAEPVQLFQFTGDGGGPVHRAGPEHFKLTRVSDGVHVSLEIAYDREELDDRHHSGRELQRRPRQVREVYSFNHQFTGVRLFLDAGRNDAKDVPRDAEYLDLYGRAKLEPGVRYRLTWACWPVGAREAVLLSCQFESSKPWTR